MSRVDIVHVSSAHPWTDNRVHLREAASCARAGYRTALVAVENGLSVSGTGVEARRLRRRGRLSRVTAGTVTAVLAALRLRPRVAHFHDPELVWAVPLFRVLGVKVVWDAHEDVPDQVRDKHYLSPKQSAALSWLARLVVRVASTSDAVVTATERIAERFPASKTTVVHNFPTYRAQDSFSTPVTSRSLRVGYIGALGVYRGSEVLPRAIADPGFPGDWTLHMAGSFSPPMERDAFLEGICGDRTVLHGQVGPDEARDLLLDTRVGIVTFLPNAAHLEALPTKMFEYLAAGIPVIASDFPLWRRMLEPHDCATFVDPNSPAQIAAAVRRYADDETLLESHSRNALRAARESFTWASQETRLIDVYRAMGIDAPRSPGAVA